MFIKTFLFVLFSVTAIQACWKQELLDRNWKSPCQLKLEKARNVTELLEREYSEYSNRLDGHITNPEVRQILNKTHLDFEEKLSDLRDEYNRDIDRVRELSGTDSKYRMELCDSMINNIQTKNVEMIKVTKNLQQQLSDALKQVGLRNEPGFFDKLERPLKITVDVLFIVYFGWKLTKQVWKWGRSGWLWARTRYSAGANAAETQGLLTEEDVGEQLSDVQQLSETLESSGTSEGLGVEARSALSEYAASLQPGKSVEAARAARAAEAARTAEAIEASEAAASAEGSEAAELVEAARVAQAARAAQAVEAADAARVADMANYARATRLAELGSGTGEGAAEAALEGALEVEGEGALEGAGEGALQAAGEGALEGAGEAAIASTAEVAGGAGAVEAGLGTAAAVEGGIGTGVVAAEASPILLPALVIGGTIVAVGSGVAYVVDPEATKRFYRRVGSWIRNIFS